MKKISLILLSPKYGFLIPEIPKSENTFLWVISDIFTISRNSIHWLCVVGNEEVNWDLRHKYFLNAHLMMYPTSAITTQTVAQLLTCKTS